MVTIESEHDQDSIHLRQISFIKDIVKMVGLEGVKAVSTPCHGLFKGFTPTDLTLDPETRKIFDIFPYRQLVARSHMSSVIPVLISLGSPVITTVVTNLTQTQIDSLMT